MMEMGPAFEQVAEIFFYDLPYVFALPVSFLLLAILLVYISRDTALRGIYCAIIQFLVTFMLWITMNSHIIHAALKDWAEWGWLALLFLYLVPISANYVVYAALEQERRRGVFWVIGLYGLCLLSLFLGPTTLFGSGLWFYRFFGFNLCFGVQNGESQGREVHLCGTFNIKFFTKRSELLLAHSVQFC